MKKSIHITAFFLLMMVTCSVQAQDINIIPKPDTVIKQKGIFNLGATTVIVLNDDGEKNTADFFNSYVKNIYGFSLKIVKRQQAPAANFIQLTTKRFIKAPDKPEHYTVTVSPKTIMIDGDTYGGTFNGMQTLIQLLPVAKNKQLAIPCVMIDDAPRFAYRGMHLDVGRHFFAVDYVKRYIDFLALHKLNTFHWHLTEDQGWRIEIKKYPLLTSVGGYRNGTIIGRYPGKGNDGIRYGGFYTQQEIKDVVKYAADRFITIIPEIEMPGHSSAAIAAYPFLSCFPEEPTKVPAGVSWRGPTTGKQVQQAWGVFDDVYCAGNEQTFSFLQDVLDEVMPLFPSTYIHIGGDECPKGNWKRCPKCQQRMKENNLSNEHQLQSYFTQRIEKYINNKGKQIIGWDEILEGGLAPNATVMSWRGDQGGIDAAKQDHDAIMCPEPYLYLNWSQTQDEDSVSFGRYTPIQKTYAYEPVPAKLDASKRNHILGAQGNLWTEYIKNTSILEYNLFPRISALSEITWSKQKNWEDFERRLMTQLKRYDLNKINYSKALFEVTFDVKPTKDYNGLAISFEKYKYKDFVHVKRDTNTYTLPVYNMNGDLISKAPIKNVEIGFTDSLVIKDGGVYTFTLGKDRRKSAQESSRLSFETSTPVSFQFNKATGKRITLASPPSTTYPGNGGAFGLVNGLSGKDFNAREWQGWNGKNMEAVIDLGKLQSISKVSLGVWKQEPSWIYLPKAVEVFVSNDGNDWKNAATESNVVKPWLNEREITITLPAGVTTRFVKIIAINHGIIAAGRAGEGKPSWLFVDEISID